MENGGIYFTQQRLHALQPPAVVLVTCRMRLSVAHCRRQYLLTVKQVVFSPRYSLISSQVKFDPVHAGCTHTHKYQGQYIAATVTLRFCYLRPNNRNFFLKMHFKNVQDGVRLYGPTVSSVSLYLVERVWQPKCLNWYFIVIVMNRLN